MLNIFLKLFKSSFSINAVFEGRNGEGLREIGRQSLVIPMHFQGGLCQTWGNKRGHHFAHEKLHLLLYSLFTLRHGGDQIIHFDHWFRIMQYKNIRMHKGATNFKILGDPITTWKNKNHYRKKIRITTQKNKKHYPLPKK